MSIKRFIYASYLLITTMLIIAAVMGYRVTSQSDQFLSTSSKVHQNSLLQLHQVDNVIDEIAFKFSIFVRQEKFDHTLFEQLNSILAQHLQRPELDFPPSITRKLLSSNEELRRAILQHINRANLGDNGSNAKDELATSKKIIDKSLHNIRQKMEERLFFAATDSQTTQILKDAITATEEIERRLNKYKQQLIINKYSLVEPINQAKAALEEIKLYIDSRIAEENNQSRNEYVDVEEHLHKALNSTNKLRTAYYQYTEEWDVMDPSASYILDLEQSAYETENIVKQDVESLIKAMGRHVDAEERRIAEHIHSQESYFTMLGAVALILIPLILLIISRMLSSPINTLRESVQTLSEGNFEHRTPPPKQVEFNKLAEDFNNMAGVIAKHSEVLKENNSKYRQILDSSPDMIFSLKVNDGELAYDYVSSAAKNIFGYPPKQWYSSPGLLHKLAHPDWQEFLTQRFALFFDGLYEKTCEFQVKHKDGSVRWIEERSKVIRDENAKVTNIVGTYTDITEKKEAADEYAESLQFTHPDKQRQCGGI